MEQAIWLPSVGTKDGHPLWQPWDPQFYQCRLWQSTKEKATWWLLKHTCIKKWLFGAQYGESIGKGDKKKIGSSWVLHSESNND